MNTETVTFKKLPAVLATQRTYALSDAVMYNTFDNENKRTPVNVTRHGVRATNNTPPKKSIDGVVDEKDVRNLQIVDSAKLDYQSSGMQVEFNISFFKLEKSLSSVAGENDQALRNSFYDFCDRAYKSEGIFEVACRYARNILNGRWLWRNRMIASEVDVTAFNKNVSVTVNALESSLKHFDNYSEQELSLATVISAGLKGDGSHKITVHANLKFGAQGSLEVYPSQNYIDGDALVSKSLYVLDKRTIRKLEGPEVVGIAAIRDQKVANAIRTIDTWYLSEDEKPTPIAIELFGANLDKQRFFRRNKDDNAFYFMKNLNVLDPNSDEGKFMIACIVRGAVYAGDK